MGNAGNKRRGPRQLIAAFEHAAVRYGGTGESGSHEPRRESALGRGPEAVSPAAPARPWRMIADFTRPFVFVFEPATVVVVAAPAGTTPAGGKLFSAVVLRAGLLSAPRAADRGVGSALEPPAARSTAGSAAFQRFVTAAPPTAHSTANAPIPA